MENENRDNQWNEPDSIQQKKEKAAVQLAEEERRMTEKRKNRTRFWGGVVVGLSFSVVVVILVLVGRSMLRYAQYQQNPLMAQASQLEFTEDSAITPTMVAKLQGLETIIDQLYSLGEVDGEKLETGIYKGLVEALEDPYSEYYTAEELNDLMEQSEGVYYGIGIYISQDVATSLPKVSGVIAGTPAEAAQLRDNDLIYEVDGVATYGLSLDETVTMIKGAEGTEVVLTIYREGESDYLKIPVARAKVESPTVVFEMLDETTAYIEIVEFDDVTLDQFTEAMAMARGSGMEGLIIDLRSNPGGNLDTVVDIARMLLPEGLIVYTEDKYGDRVEYTCDGTRELEVPLVVLIDMNSASAAEILAGAVQDYGIGTLVGTTTFGKGIVQQVLPFKDGSAMKLTISSYFTPSGRNIHGVGIEPDVVCEFDSEAYYDEVNPVDNQLEKAKEVLKSLQ